MNKNNSSILFFDKDCRLCIKFKDKLEELAPKESIIFKDINEFKSSNLESKKNELTFIDSNKNITSGYMAVLAIAEVLPSIRKFVPLMKTTLVSKAGNSVYNMVSRNRKRFCSSCK